MSRIFLSHTSTDKPFVRKLAADLRLNGHTVWIDEAEINIGDSLIAKIREGLDSVDFVAAVLSKASIESEWVTKELDIASNREIKEKRVFVLPLIIEHVKLPGFLEGKLYGDFSEESKYKESLDLLLRTLGDSKPIKTESEDELKMMRAELERARAKIKQHEDQLNKVVTHSLLSKSEELRSRIEQENQVNPNYAPINNVYAFEVDGMPITIGYLLHVLRKSTMKGGHQFEWILTLHNQWDDANRMLEAYADMIKSKEESK
ncbi:toll/interleukin-1 receptor domain-containing protein [Flavobacterium sp. MAH-1]|uniref:Toll/interleukin-1 receptor domain-containing protein n=1 Tax=Flavobacterium agri TaxID=2743471 RepID=A0A7Y8Y3Y2_9FLAO|nr:toll/interleukin-1 receptor domain-containing protein [Flavobacterium agri]NUY81893.1 toll/interleukin-1 receptor domain-containing protein [Flavobacterium agri]NYA71917.1 toll/interleukin-1 receptor domain-containing protein [Flavobacterium agri]